jgi:hypothetical protein
MSALPRQVRKQVEEANKLHEQLARNGLDQAAAAAAQPPPTPPAGEAPPAAAPEGAAPAAPPAEGWEQKYRVLQGKYNAEVPRLQKQAQTQAQQIETLTAQLTATQGMVASIAQNRGPAPAGQGSAPAAPAKLVKDEEVSEFGEELTDFIRRVAQDTVLPKVEERRLPRPVSTPQVRRSDRHRQTAKGCSGYSTHRCPDGENRTTTQSSSHGSTSRMLTRECREPTC